MSEPREWIWTGDQDEDNFRWLAFVHFRFDVAEYDEWLRSLPPCPTRDELLRIRAEAKAEGLHGRPMKRLLHLLKTSREAIVREAVRLPLAEKGKAFAQGRPPGAVDEVTRYLRRERRSGESAKPLWERLKKPRRVRQASRLLRWR